MPKQSQVLALLELGWSYRRIEAEIGVRPETVSRYDRSAPTESADLLDVVGSNAAKTFAGPDANPAKTLPASAAACHRQERIILSMTLAPTSFHPVVER